MEELISALKEFETRNNISASIIINSDGSCGLMEFWSEEDLGNFNSTEDLLKFLLETQYALDEKGLCLNPYQIKSNKTAAATVTAKVDERTRLLDEQSESGHCK